MCYVAAKFMPHQLSEDQKPNHNVDITKELVNLANADENFLKNIVTGDDTWV
jgi:DNA polymerase IIIc chi subunit